MHLPSWRALCAREPVLANRRQSLAFIRGENLQPVALRPTSNHLDPGAKRSIAEWVHVDGFQSDTGNWGAVLRPPFLDVDIDILPLRGIRDQAFLDEAMAVIESVESSFKAAGVQFRSFGRRSFGYRGHLIVPCACNKEEAKLLSNLHMAKGVRCGNVVVRIEVRRPVDQEEPKDVHAAGQCVSRRSRLPRPDRLERALRVARGRADPRHGHQPVKRLTVGLYAALMALAVVPHWEEGDARHGSR